jgi:two-component system, LytTR family, sensor kinase
MRLTLASTAHHVTDTAEPDSVHWARMLALAVGAVLLLTMLEASQLMMRASLEGWRITLPSVLMRALVSWVVLAVLSVLVWQVALRVPLSPWTARTLAIHTAAMVAFTAMHIAGTTVALMTVDARHTLQHAMSYFGVAYVALDVLLYALIVGIAHTWSYARLAAQRTLTAVQLSEALQRAQLDVVRRQLDPHFLFNTLNSISAVALRGDGAATADAIAVLSDLLRQTLRSDAPTLHTVAQELDYVQRYLTIMQLRFPDAIQLTIAAEPEAMRARIPCLVLQPLVENAVAHGFAAGSQRGTITIRASVSASQLTVQVDDDGAGLPADRQDGIGLSSLRARLQYGFGPAGQLSFSRGAHGIGTCVTVRLPLVMELP